MNERELLVDCLCLRLLTSKVATCVPLAMLDARAVYPPRQAIYGSWALGVQRFARIRITDH
jgi:hypothetical protein